MQLSENFSLEELTFTTHRELDNTPPAEVVARLAHILAPGLETVRKILGGLPIHINSGFRSPAVNAAVGGAVSSAHVLGFAGDLICPQFGPPLAVCKRLIEARQRGEIDFDQLIFEYADWTHISFDPRMRGEVLTKTAGHPYTPGLPTI